jgi:hypothetical protein
MRMSLGIIAAAVMLVASTGAAQAGGPDPLGWCRRVVAFASSLLRPAVDHEVLAPPGDLDAGMILAPPASGTMRVIVPPDRSGWRL